MSAGSTFVRGSFLMGACLGFALSSLPAGEVPVKAAAPSLAAKERMRRDAVSLEAQALLTEAGILYDKGDFEMARRQYRQAWDLFPVGQGEGDLKSRAREGYSRAAIAQARKLAEGARYAESRALVDSVLAPNFDPTNPEALALKEHLNDPERYEPALTPAHLANVEAVEKLLLEGHSLFSLGNFDGAIQKFRAVLVLDKYNSAARRGMEQAEQSRGKYFESARDHSRARMLSQVDQLWEDNVPAIDVSGLFGSTGATMGALGGFKESVLLKLRTIVVPIVDLQGASLEEVVEFMRIRSRELDPKKRGVDFVLKVSPEISAKPVTISMSAVPFEEVLRYATEMTGTVYRVDEFAVTITSRTEKSETLISKSYRVPPDFLQNAPAGTGPAAAAPLDPFAANPGGAPQGMVMRRLGAREFLLERGVLFPEGASAAYNPGTNILTVRNTAENLALIDTYVDQALNATAKQVEIQVRMIEINESRLQELGFDWLLGQFNVPGSERVFMGGGTQGNQANGAGESPFGANPVTAGLRSSGDILGVPSIDALIRRSEILPSVNRSPGAFAVSGVFTDPQFQMVLRAVSQSKGVDVLAAPTIITKSGQRANITVSREFRYPTEFDPPQVPQSLSATIGTGDTNTIFTSNFSPITPSTPTAFEMRDVGISLEVEPVVGDGNRTVDLNLVPSSVEFEGFIDYGTDIQNSAPIGIGGASVFYTVPNDILQPVFRTNKVTTSVTVWDGNTIVLGGVTFEKRQTIDDKVPVIGDIPLGGRSFQSKVGNVERKNVIFFVTVKVIDPAGNRVTPVEASPTVSR